MLDLFSGIGGFCLGFEQAGFQTLAFCEIDPFCQAVLQKHWPHPSPSTATSANSTEIRIEELSISSAGDTPVSPSAWPDHVAAQQMIGISGRKCIDWYERLGRDGSLPKMLLGILASVSTRLPHRWKLKASPSGRLLFQLQPSMHRTDATGSGLWPTPTAQMRGRPEIALQQALKGEPLYKRRNKAGVGRQFSIVDYLIYREFLPTPTATEAKGATNHCRRIKEGDVSYLRYCLHFYLKPSSVTSYPHPSFVERMMGYPIGHTRKRDHSANRGNPRSRHRRL